MVSFGKRKALKRATSAGMSELPPGAQLVPVNAKNEYEQIPLHIYHPNPYDAITILRNKKDPHDWLVCGWYVDTLREGGRVKGLVYRMVRSDEDKEAVIAELKKKDKDAVPRFTL